MLAAQIDETNVVTGIYHVLDLDFMPRLVEDVTGQAGIGDTYDHETAQFIRPAEQLLPGESLAAMQQRLATTIDNLIAGMYARWTRFEPEYTAREAAARAFVASGYADNPSLWITSFAVPARLSTVDAANRIIVQADALHAALQELAALRMAKYGILGAADAARAQAEYDAIAARVGVIAAGLQ